MHEKLWNSQMYNTVGILFYLNPVCTFTFYIPNIDINVVHN